jgi:5'-nucleotidase
VAPHATYRITVPNFIAGGGNGHTVIAGAAGYRYDTGIMDVDALVAFLAAHSPVSRPLEGRVTVVAPPHTSPGRL